MLNSLDDCRCDTSFVGFARHRRNGFSLTELAAVIVAISLMLCMLMPAIGRVKSDSGVQVSLNNLNTLHKAMVQYGADWNDRQPTAIVDDFSTYGNTVSSAFFGYDAVHGNHPESWLGLNCPETAIYFLSYGATYIPIDFESKNGSFRLPHTRMIHDYVDGRCFSAAFFAPNDRTLFPIVEPWFQIDCEFIPIASLTGNTMLRSSYMRSPAAMFDPGVLRANANGGFRDPFSYATGFASPTFSQAKYTHLKTQLLEHNWNQNTPANVCSPWFVPSNTPCEPYYFNHGHASAPATLFYDGSTRLLPNAEVIAADAQILKQTNNVDGLWHRGTPLGAQGYFSQFAYDTTVVNHHILTTDGIKGRDTIAGPDKP